MTATPIPRTLAMTLYGDLDVSIIDDMPQKRLVKTIHCYDYDRERVFNFIYKEILNGYQVYIIYPIIGYSQKTNLKSLLIEYNKIIQSSILHKCRISILHGNMGYKSKIKSMNDFLNKKSDIMIATTAIEVGIHIPNVSVILIENSEQFGLSQLHQLRGRIGRNSINSYCILMTSKTISQKAKMRINTMKQMHNGFDIANVDLKIRGPGNFSGIEQSGMIKLKIANLYKDINILSLSKEAAHEYIMSKKN
ncbi:MAG: hypothetical protein IR527_00445 [Bacteroides sp.]|nr:MAG: hypothetical protein IR527_00445 [Bacteroides sp.]